VAPAVITSAASNIFLPASKAGFTSSNLPYFSIFQHGFLKVCVCVALKGKTALLFTGSFNIRQYKRIKLPNGYNHPCFVTTQKQG
jgi:hypothetical protein